MGQTWLPSAPTDPRSLGAAAGQKICQRMRMACGKTVSIHACRLVEHEQVRIFINNRHVELRFPNRFPRQPDIAAKKAENVSAGKSLSLLRRPTVHKKDV